MEFVEIFKSIQGEGFWSGAPSIFARTSGCNLRCCFAGGSICDTSYTSYFPEQPTLTENDLYAMIEANPQICHVVFTGGEPLLHAKKLQEVVDHIKEHYDSIITIETNGTLAPLQGHSVDLYSISPKLSTSIPKNPCDIDVYVNADNGQTIHYTQDMIDLFNSRRINIPVLKQFLENDGSLQIKFVYSGPESLEEIDKIISDLKNEGNDTIDSWVMLMPEGQTDQQIQQRRKEAIEICVDRGWTYTDRLQVLVWGDKRGV